MADPICRWRNPFVSTIIELVKILPHEVMPSDKFRIVVEKRWPGFFHTPYQLACQVGLYYESDDGLYYPRFDHDIDETEALSYMKRWITRYYVPNPYTKSLKTLQQPQPFLASIIGYICKHPNETGLHSILETVFQEKIGNIDIISNVLNTYTDLVKVDTLGNVELTVKAIDFMKQYIDRNDKKAFFEYFSESESAVDDSLSKNLIFYGAPGTGKSFAIKRETEGRSVVRTTFHPDSDYSTFVGAYKPTSIEVPVMTIIGKEQVPVENAKPEKKIVYDFVPQAFLKAYTGAWKNQDEPFFLIIEEINRGNCAQIFGDLFQLLDRNDETGLSDYPISPDEDIQKFLLTDRKFGFAELTEQQKAAIPEEVQAGELLILPNNLHIWATMNTSDQSLFPIDSAFKRRWDWQYIPISNGNKGWQIEVMGARYDWWDFLTRMNEKISSTTHSEDKKLGYYFCKTKDGIIDAKTFVGKVIFYVWNDVFKNFAEEAGDLFKDENGDLLSYDKFYGVGADGKTKVLEDKVALFLEHLEVKPVEETNSYEVEEEVEDETARNQKKESLVSIQIPNNPTINSSDSTQFGAFVEALKTIGIGRIIPIAGSLKYQRLGCPVLSTQKDSRIENNDNGYSYHQEGGLFIIKGCKSYTYIRILEDLNKLLNVGLSLITQ